jgi:hypothetical protein
MDNVSTELTMMAANSKRLVFINYLLGFIPDLIMSWIIVKIFHWGLEYIFLAFLGLQILYLTLWFKNTIWTWIVFAVFNRRIGANGILTLLRAGQFPEPEEDDAPDNYLKGIIADETSAPDLRILAMAEYKSLIDASMKGRIQDNLRHSMAYIDALKMYKGDFS